ncbi:MAG: gliding motility lipoprotein GldH, partial [Duncaniella sp.]|nr:gliding motility lipoprotein GldH [Duncaniella sp.]
MRRLFPILTAIMFVAALVVACGDGRRDYSRWERVADQGWAYGDTILLEVLNPALEDNDSSLSDCTLLLGLRHTYAYPYS